jgi:histidinol-phosphatase
MSTVDPPEDEELGDLDSELALAVELADACDLLTLPLFERGSLTVGWKADRTEVTDADRAAEAMIAERLVAIRPEHSVYGEEYGRTGSTESPWQWIVDPIDGTSGFARGIPVWATLIALSHRRHGVVVGVVSAPALGRRWWARRGGGTFADGRPCTVSAVSTLADAQVSVTFSHGWDELGLTHELVRLVQGARRARGFGDFWQHALVAEGALDLAVDAVGVAPYDLAAVSLLVEEAGGRFTDREGVATHEHDTAISSNGLLHQDVIARLSTS